MSKILTLLALHPATLALLEAQLRDGGGEERQPAPRKFVLSDEREETQMPKSQASKSRAAPLQKLAVWTGQEPGERIANTILLCAIRDRAHQVTLEPQAKGVKVRFEIESGVREQKLPAFALEPIVRHFTSLIGEATNDEAALQLSGEARLAVDEQLYDVQFSPLPTRWGSGVKVRLSPQK